MPTIKQSYENLVGRKVSDSTIWRIKKLLNDNGLIPNRENVKTFAVAKKSFITNKKTISYMVAVSEMSNIKPTKKSEVVNILKSKNVPYQTYHRWLSDVPNGYLDKKNLTNVLIKLLNWSKKNGCDTDILNSLPLEKSRL